MHMKPETPPSKSNSNIKIIKAEMLCSNKDSYTYSEEGK